MHINRQIHEETRKLWWESNTFEVILSGAAKLDICLQITYDEPDQDIVETSIAIHLRPQNISLIRKWHVIGAIADKGKWKYDPWQMEPRSYELCSVVGPRIDYATLKIPHADLKFLSNISTFLSSFPLALLQKMTHVEGQPGQHFHTVVLQAAIQNRIEAILRKPISEPSVDQLLEDDRRDKRRPTTGLRNINSDDNESEWEESTGSGGSWDEESREELEDDGLDDDDDAIDSNTMMEDFDSMHNRSWM
ncbi:hypothetical protein LTS18_003993 [Coniosporium uncinatum]|uniref:Uncharacterized protein n=1 Tax=Coniosporium uncinatum TaxID=93489 RepID=A0ACC3DT79_9PEZI|nr:hypothetical protein LTS18_003993 [Coniosporium uncinatum]